MDTTQILCRLTTQVYYLAEYYTWVGGNDTGYDIHPLGREQIFFQTDLHATRFKACSQSILTIAFNIENYSRQHIVDDTKSQSTYVFIRSRHKPIFSKHKYLPAVNTSPFAVNINTYPQSTYTFDVKTFTNDVK